MAPNKNVGTDLRNGQGLGSGKYHKIITPPPLVNLILPRVLTPVFGLELQSRGLGIQRFASS
jgi:hypothetical protein